jgi:proline dehydrogenase
MPSLPTVLTPSRLLGELTGGESAYDAVERARGLTDAGRLVALEHAPGSDPERATGELELAMSCIAAEGLGPVVELIVLPERVTDLDRLVAIAADTGVAITLGIGPGSDLRRTLELHASLGGAVGITLPASWRGTEGMCAHVTGRVRIVKGADAFGLPDGERFSHDLEVDKAFVRAARALISRALIPRSASSGDAGVHPSLATQDGRIIAIAETLAARARLGKGAVEFAMHLGRGAGLQERLVNAGESVRVIVPFGPGRLERLAAGVLERPGGIAGAVRSIVRG